MNYLQQNIHAIIRPGDEKGYIAECMEISVVTQGMTLDKVAKNLVEAVSLHIEDEDLTEFGLVAKPSLSVTFEQLDTGTCRAILKQASKYISLSELSRYFYD